MNELNYWVRLSLCFLPGSEKPNLLLQDLESPESVFESDPAALEELGYLTEEERAALRSAGGETAERILSECARLGILVIAKDDPRYPESLRESESAPSVLYLKGEAETLGLSPVFTITGSDRISEYGKRVTGNLCYELTRAGAVAAAGYRSETDRYVHLGALRAGGGPSVAVLDCGIDQRARSAFRDLSEDGIVFVSELPPGTKPSKEYRSAYVRLLSGISLGTVVTELGESGTASEIARCVSDLGKDLFCVPPHDLFDPECSGVIRYLRQGAYPVFCAKDILGEYEDLYSGILDLSRLLDQYAGGRRSADPADGKAKPAGMKGGGRTPGESADDGELLKRPKTVPAELDENEKLVYNCMEFLPKTVPEIAEASSVGRDEVLPILNALVKKGYVVPYSGQRFGLLNK